MVFFEIGKQIWGKGADGEGAALGADGTIVNLRRAYIDWLIPNSDSEYRVRGIMGFQGRPSFALKQSQFFADVVAGGNFSGTFNDNVSVTAFWGRPFNDNFNGYDKDGSKSGANYMGNVEMFGLVVLLSFRGVR